MSSFTFKEILESVYKRVDDLEVIIPSLAEVQSKLQKLDNVQSCVAFGCGYGLFDLLFVEHCMPNVSEFIAIEPDAACAAYLRAELPSQLPNAKSVVFEETVQNWQGVNHPVDAVLLIHFLYYSSPSERLLFYQRLMDNILHSGSYVFVLIHPHHTCGDPSAFCRAIQLLKSSEHSDEFVTDQEVRDTMSSVGFELCSEQTYSCHLNVEDPDDAFLSLLLSPDGSWSLESVRQAAKEAFGDSKKVRHNSWLGIFRKP